MSVNVAAVNGLNQVALGTIPEYVNFKARVAIRRAAFETIPGATNIETNSALITTFVPRAIIDESNR